MEYRGDVGHAKHVTAAANAIARPLIDTSYQEAVYCRNNFNRGDSKRTGGRAGTIGLAQSTPLGDAVIVYIFRVIPILSMQRVLVDLSVHARSIIDDDGSDQGGRAGSDENRRGVQKRDNCQGYTMTSFRLKRMQNRRTGSTYSTKSAPLVVLVIVFATQSILFVLFSLSHLSLSDGHSLPSALSSSVIMTFTTRHFKLSYRKPLGTRHDMSGTRTNDQTPQTRPGQIC